MENETTLALRGLSAVAELYLLSFTQKQVGISTQFFFTFIPYLGYIYFYVPSGIWLS